MIYITYAKHGKILLSNNYKINGKIITVAGRRAMCVVREFNLM
jgi:hypothetical protein